ncbi:MAG: helix-hairpin-helix domain-containing protein [Planctomycetota bacterium]
MNRSVTRHRARRGAVLVLVMWLLLIVGLLALGLSQSARVSASLGYGEVERVQARWLARAGVEQAVAALAFDGIGGDDGRGDLWYDSPEMFEDVALATDFTFRVTAPSFEDAEDASAPRFGLDDEASRVSVNAERPRQFRRIPDIETAQADAILDWLDNNEAARPGGAERGYYSQLDFPYLIRNSAFRTHRELLLVRGIDAEAFFGEDGDLDGVLDRAENDGDESWPADTPDRTLELGLAGYTSVYAYELNTDPLGAPRIDLSETDTDTLIEQFNFTPALAEAVVEAGRSADNLFDFVGTRGDGEIEDEQQIDEITIEWLADFWEYLTLEEDERLPGKVNVNTASRAVLETIPRMSANMAEDIISYRSSQGSFTGVGELYSGNVLTRRQFERVAPFVTVRSNVFRVVSEGRTPSGTRYAVAAVIDRGGDQPVILDWRQP